jgi:hypothetical protein
MASIPDCTLTTQYYSLTKYNGHSRSIEEHKATMEPLLKVPCYLVIYCDNIMKPIVEEMRSKYNLMNLTQIIVEELEDTWGGQFIDIVKKNREVYWPTRDERTCAENHVLQCNKYYFVLKTVDNNPFNTTKFGWIDGNIGVNGSKISEVYNNNTLLHILNNLPDKFHIQILNVCDKKFKLPENKREYYTQYRYVVCGSFFTFSPKYGVNILKRHMEVSKHTMIMGYGHADEMTFLEILDEFYDDIHRGYGDYRQILDNYFKPVKNMVYIYWNIVMRYFNFGYYRECIDVCKSILSSYDSFENEINYDMYLRIYAVMYLSQMRTNSDQTEITANKIRNYYNTNPYFKSHFDNLKNLVGLNNFVI